MELGRYANDNYVKPAAAQLADPNLKNNVSNYVNSFSQPKVCFVVYSIYAFGVLNYLFVE